MNTSSGWEQISPKTNSHFTDDKRMLKSSVTISSELIIPPVSAWFASARNKWCVYIYFSSSKSWAELTQAVVPLTLTNQQWGKARPHVGFKTCQNTLVFIIHLRHQSKQASKHPNVCAITAPSCCQSQVTFRRRTPARNVGLLGLKWRQVTRESSC